MCVVCVCVCVCLCIDDCERQRQSIPRREREGREMEVREGGGTQSEGGGGVKGDAPTQRRCLTPKVGHSKRVWVLIPQKRDTRSGFGFLYFYLVSLTYIISLYH